MRKKLLVFALSFTMVAGVLTGCGNSEINELENLGRDETSQSNSNEEVATEMGYTLEDQKAIYKQVSDRKSLDLSTLEACEDSEINQVNDFMNTLDNQLIGKVTTKDGVVEEQYINYLLANFELTPYYWQRSSMSIKGRDTASRNIVVDVTYKTIGYNKKVDVDSKIIMGEPNYTKLMSARFNKFMQIMEAKHNNGDYRKNLNKFEKVYGKVSQIYKSQASKSLAEDICNDGNQITYSGLQDSEEEKSTATMTVRFVLVPSYKLGVNLGIKLRHMYITNYALDKNPTEGKEAYTGEGYDEVIDNVIAKLTGLFKSVEDNNFRGLYTDIVNFQKLDKYYYDMFNTSYSKYTNPSITLFNVAGTDVECGVTISTKTRCKGSNMTYPIYKDSYLCKIGLDGEDLKVNQLILISRELEGEPEIKTAEADVEGGFSSTVELNNDDRLALENLISKFSELQLQGKDENDKEFVDVVDTSISMSEMADLKAQMNKFTGSSAKSVYIDTYLQGTQDFATIRCKEYYQDKETSKVKQCVATYTFARKSNYWYIFKYGVANKVDLDTTTLNTTDALCYVTAEKGVESQHSQVSTKDDTRSLDSKKDVSVTYNYNEYTPSKGAVNKKENVVTLISTKDLTDEQIDNILKATVKFATYKADLEEYKKKDKKNEKLADTLIDNVKTVAMIIANNNDNRYDDITWIHKQEELNKIREDYTNISGSIEDKKIQEDIESYANAMSQVTGG